jgi:hypothetical protein
MAVGAFRGIVRFRGHREYGDLLTGLAHGQIEAHPVASVYALLQLHVERSAFNNCVARFKSVSKGCPTTSCSSLP